jgi:zinc transporter ZupT
MIGAYILIVLGVVVWAVVQPLGKSLSPRLMRTVTVFGGAYLLAICFINLLPHLFLHGFTSPTLGVKYAAAIPLGFLIQTLLEQLSSHVEHGHLDEHSHAGHNHEGYTLWGLLLGLSLHAFFEGLPLVDTDGDIHQGLLYGIVLHNIPMALIFVSLMSARGYGFWRVLALLTIFAVMTPLGSICNLTLLPPDEELQTFIIGIVVGILLHVSSSILFDHHDNRFSWAKVLLIVIAFTAAYFTPGCAEIY